MPFRRIVIFLVLVLLSAASQDVLAKSLLSNGKGSFVFQDKSGNYELPITVWYNRPVNVEKNADIVFVMHGVKRNGEQYRDDWVSHSEKHRFLLIVPEFSEQYYPKSTYYQFGNIINQNENKWTFSAIEHLFDFIRAQEQMTADTYYIYGHSGWCSIRSSVCTFHARPPF